MFLSHLEIFFLSSIIEWVPVSSALLWAWLPHFFTWTSATWGDSTTTTIYTILEQCICMQFGTHLFLNSRRPFGFSHRSSMQEPVTQNTSIQQGWTNQSAFISLFAFCYAWWFVHRLKHRQKPVATFSPLTRRRKCSSESNGNAKELP